MSTQQKLFIGAILFGIVVLSPNVVEAGHEYYCSVIDIICEPGWRNCNTTSWNYCASTDRSDDDSTSCGALCRARKTTCSLPPNEACPHQCDLDCTPTNPPPDCYAPNTWKQTCTVTVVDYCYVPFGYSSGTHTYTRQCPAPPPPPPPPIKVVINQLPVVNAGLDQSINFGLPTVTTNLDGTVTDDGFPSPLTTQWIKVSGPGNVVFGNSSRVDTTATFNASGMYVLRLTASDGTTPVPDEVQITVVNNPPSVSVNPATLSVDFGFLPVRLQGTVSDDGLPNPPNNLTITWIKQDGPSGGNVTFSNPNAATTDVTLSQAGGYVLRLEAFDGEHKSTFDVTMDYGAPARYGLLPCGVIIDDPQTPWDETENCELKHFFLLLKNVIDFTLWKLVPLIIILLVVATGAIFFFQLGGPEVMAKVRMIWTAVGKGVLILLFSWLFLNFLLGILGFDINIFGRWYEITP